jgi:hypothetical protein
MPFYHDIIKWCDINLIDDRIHHAHRFDIRLFGAVRYQTYNYMYQITAWHDQEYYSTFTFYFKNETDITLFSLTFG